MSDLKRYSEALACYEKALEIDPLSEFAWCGRGNVLKYLLSYEGALACYEKALEINPSFERVWYDKACYYALEVNIDFALENLERAISLNSKFLKEAATDPDFDQIRSDERFKVLIGEE